MKYSEFLRTIILELTNVDELQRLNAETWMSFINRNEEVIRRAQTQQFQNLHQEFINFRDRSIYKFLEQGHDPEFNGDRNHLQKTKLDENRDNQVWFERYNEPIEVNTKNTHNQPTLVNVPKNYRTPTHQNSNNNHFFESIIIDKNYKEANNEPAIFRGPNQTNRKRSHNLALNVDIDPHQMRASRGKLLDNQFDEQNSNRKSNNVIYSNQLNPNQVRRIHDNSYAAQNRMQTSNDQK